MENRLELAHYLCDLFSKVYALDAQCEVYCQMAETMSDAFNDDQKKAIQLRKLFVQHGKGLVRSADFLRNNTYCDGEIRDRIVDIQKKIDLRNDLLMEEMIQIIKENDSRSESEIETELNDEIEKTMFKYNLSV